MRGRVWPRQTSFGHGMKDREIDTARRARLPRRQRAGAVQDASRTSRAGRKGASASAAFPLQRLLLAPGSTVQRGKQLLRFDRALNSVRNCAVTKKAILLAGGAGTRLF